MNSSHNIAIHQTSHSLRLPLAGDRGRVCRAWHRTCGVEVPTPGFRRAEGKEKGKGDVARRGLKEAQSEDAGRRTGTGYEVWYVRGEWARDHGALHRQEGRAL
ncbi:MAG: hypothetical protein C4582_06855 [Desulfobacteraceae bacterium]|nr:MAG: hypothetical protein C4582_06855 [Desulfobacteraceae bacterium]